MMMCKGKEVMEEIHSLAKVSHKQTLVERKEIQKMLKWIHMGSKEQEWAKRASLGGLFTIHWTIPWGDLLEEFLRTWESINNRWTNSNLSLWREKSQLIKRYIVM
jgi:hypothetical protein